MRTPGRRAYRRRRRGHLWRARTGALLVGNQFLAEWRRPPPALVPPGSASWWLPAPPPPRGNARWPGRSIRRLLGIGIAPAALGQDHKELLPDRSDLPTSAITP